MHFIDLGSIPYEDAYRLQCAAVEEVAAGGEERVFLLEHPDVFTIGRRGDERNLLSDSGPRREAFTLHRINRGGDITYHGPGQLVGYLHLDLRPRGRDVGAFLRGLEEALIRTVAEFGIRGFRRTGLTGVWTDSGKLASVGIGVRHWVTMHGFALNVNTDLTRFQLINPCGIEGCPMVSVASLTGSRADMPTVKERFKESLQEIFLPVEMNGS